MKSFHFNPVKAAVGKLRQINADPLKVCYGFSFGIFMATTPLIGIKWIVALPIVWLLKWNKTACLLGIIQVNYLTGPFYYALAYFLGKEVCGYSNALELPGKMSPAIVKDLFFGNADVFVSLVVGGLIIGIPLTAVAFYLVKSLFHSKLKIQAI
jgi:uncharacterized protein (DUF2062 family)